MAVIRRRDIADELQWIHTGHVLALLANINRGKGGKTYSWQEFSPYDHEGPATDAQPVTRDQYETAKRWAANWQRHGKK